jgi:hypothetical protein
MPDPHQQARKFGHSVKLAGRDHPFPRIGSAPMRMVNLCRAACAVHWRAAALARIAFWDETGHMRRWPGTVIRWIDRDLASSYRPGRLSLFVPLLVPIFLSWLASGLSGALRLAALAGIATLTVGWVALFAWRATIAIRAFALKGDRGKPGGMIHGPGN